jgi:hypothetical protein
MVLEATEDYPNFGLTLFHAHPTMCGVQDAAEA